MSRLLTWVLRLLPVLGVVLAVIGSQEWYPESWLDSKGFAINLASGVTAACFGLPLAFFVLQRMLRDREDARNREAILVAASTALTEIHRAIRRILRATPNDPGEGLARSRLLQSRASLADALHERSGLPTRESLEDLSDAIMHLKVDFDRSKVDEHWASIQSLWRFLSVETVNRARFEGFSLELPERAIIHIERTLEKDPFEPFSSLSSLDPWDIRELSEKGSAEDLDLASIHANVKEACERVAELVDLRSMLDMIGGQLDSSLRRQSLS